MHKKCIFYLMHFPQTSRFLVVSSVTRNTSILSYFPLIRRSHLPAFKPRHAFIIKVFCTLHSRHYVTKNIFRCFTRRLFVLLFKTDQPCGFDLFLFFFTVFILFLHLNYLNLNNKHIKRAFMSAARRLVAHYRASMGVFTRHQWALLPAHKESRSRVCAQCESLRSEAALSSVLLGSILWKCSWRRSRNTLGSARIVLGRQMYL